jgi:hypothetical protein
MKLISSIALPEKLLNCFHSVILLFVLMVKLSPLCLKRSLFSTHQRSGDRQVVLTKITFKAIADFNQAIEIDELKCLKL